MNSRAASFALVALALGGCQDGSSSSDQFGREFTLHWSPLKDGSQFAKITPANGNRSEAIRCWPSQLAGFDCLRAGMIDANGIGATTVVKSMEASLPNTSLGYVSGSEGYSCTYVMGYLERIDRGGATLISNRPGYDQAAWSKGFVDRYIASNGIRGTGYFQCLDVLEAVKTGSLETLNTTSISKSMLR